MKPRVPIALVLALLSACASKVANEPAVVPTYPSPPARSKTIHLLHADAHEIARTLNDLLTASFWKIRSGNCVLYKFDDDGQVQAPTETELALAELEGREVSRTLDPDELTHSSAESIAERLHLYLDRSGVTSNWSVVRPPPTFLAWDSRTLVVLEALREPEYFTHVRDLVRRLDAPSDG